MAPALDSHVSIAGAAPFHAVPTRAVPLAPARTLAPEVSVIPISGPLGLADISVELSEPDLVPVLVLRQQPRHAADLQIRMFLTSESNGKRTFKTRVYAGKAPAEPAASDRAVETPVPSLHADSPNTIHFSIRLIDPSQPLKPKDSPNTDTNASEARTLGPFIHTAQPPTVEIVSEGQTLQRETSTPDWAKGCVWYQVFPERFRNGNRGNDPTGLAFFHKPWTSDWKSVRVDELEALWLRTGSAEIPRPPSRARVRGQLDNVMHDRRYGGDLQGIVEKLDELHDLGVDALYLNPIFHAQSLHKYDASDFRHIDPALGNPGTPSRAELDNRLAEDIDPQTWVWTPADRYFVDVLLVEARKRGMRIIIDGVWNHVGTEFWAFRDVQEHGAGSRYAKWFDARFADAETFPEWESQPTDLRPGKLIGWKSWGGGGRNGGLPELARDPARGKQRLLPEIESHVWAVTQRWMDPNADGDPSDGIDGWRLDVVPDVPMPFWTAWREHVKSINPNAILHCEVWFDAKDYFGGRAFDGQMNYPFAMPLVRWLSAEPGATSDRLALQLERAFSHAPQTDLVQMNLLMSHDTDRLVSRLANPGFEYDQGAQVSARGTTYNDARPDPRVYDLSVLACAIQATFAGSPMIYCGDELGMYGADDPDCRKPNSWLDLGTFDNAAESGQSDVRARYRSWLTLRRDPLIGDVLRYGSVRMLTGNEPDLLAFERELNGLRVRVLANRSDRTLGIEGLIEQGWRRLFGDSTDDSGTIGPRLANVWVFERH